MASLYNVFVPGFYGRQVNIGKISGGLTTNYPVNGTMFYGVSANSVANALEMVQVGIGTSLSEAASVYLQSNDTRQDH